MKKATAIILSALLALSCLTVFAGAAWDGSATEAFSGSGTAADPYVIDTPAKLAKLAADVNGGEAYSGKYFTQTADIDLGNKEWTPIGDAANPFSGVYNGQGHTIKGLSITVCVAKTGLFGKIKSADFEAGVANLTLEGAIAIDGNTTVGAASIGALAGQVNDNYNATSNPSQKYATFTNITNNVTLTITNEGKEPRAGAVFGELYYANLENCVNNGNASKDTVAVARLGGFCGQFSYANFKGCVNNGNLTVVQNTAGKGVNMAGFGGFCTTPGVKREDGSYVNVFDGCMNNGAISGEAKSNGTAVAVAGFVGNFYTGVAANYLKITNSANTGKITSVQPDGGSAYSYAGGFLGNGPSSSDYIVVENCVSTVSVADITSTGGNGKRAGAIAGAFYANTKEHMWITDAISAADSTLPMGEAYKTPNQDAEKATWIYDDAQKASGRAAEIRGALALSLTKINGIEVTTQQQPPVNPDPTPSNPDTGDAVVWTLIVASVALVGAAVALKTRKEN